MPALGFACGTTDQVGHGLLEPNLLGHGPIQPDRLYRENPAFRCDDRSIAHQFRNRFGVQGRGHCKKNEVIAQCFAHL